MTTKIEKRYLRPSEAAIYLGVAESTIWNWIKTKKLSSKKISAKVTILDKIELDAYIATF